MNTRCNRCGFDLTTFPATVDLSGKYHQLYCPVCSRLLEEMAEFPGVFYDTEAKEYVVWVVDRSEEGKKQFRYGWFSLAITGRKVNPYDLCHKGIVIFQDRDQLWLPYSGLRPEYHHYLKPDAQVSGRWDPPYYYFQPPLRGDYTVNLRLEAIVSPEPENSAGTALNLWPNFRRQGWRNYFVYFASTDPNIKLTQLRVFGEQGEKKTFPGPTARGETNFVPAFIEILVVHHGEEFGSVFQVKLEHIQPPSGGNQPDLIPILALDFGTSNTCFAVKFTRTGPDEPQIVRFRDRTCRLIQSLSPKDQDHINNPWFPGVENHEEAPYHLPSELGFPREVVDLGDDVREYQPIANYTIPPFTRYREGEETRILREIKWERGLSQVPSLQPFVYDLQFLYLSLAMRIALAEIASDRHCQRLDQIHFVATCPMAFTDKQRDKFREVLSRVQENIASQTGINLILQQIYDESRAGEAGSGQPTGTRETIYVDVGGGTTDVGYFRYEPKESGGERAIYLESIQYAGDDVWDALAGSALTVWPQVRFEREARARSAASIFNEHDLEPFRNQMHNLQRATDGVHNFIDGLIEYLSRMIAAREMTRGEQETAESNLGICLLGNGWRFVEALGEYEEERPASSAEITSRVRQLLLERLNRHNVRRPDLEVVYPADPKTVVAIGAITLFFVQDQAPETSFSICSFVGTNLKVSAQTTVDVEWYRTVPYTLPPELRIKAINYQIIPEFSFEQAEVGDRDIRIDNLAIQALRRSARQNVIHKNIFSHYLEFWHKRKERLLARRSR